MLRRLTGFLDPKLSYVIYFSLKLIGYVLLYLQTNKYDGHVSFFSRLPSNAPILNTSEMPTIFIILR